MSRVPDMANAIIKIRDLANGKLSVKLVLDPRQASTPSHQAAQSFFSWLKNHETTQSQTAAPQQQP